MSKDNIYIARCKKNFRDHLSKGNILSIQELYLYSDSPCGQAQRELLKWYKNIVELTFLADLPKNLEEIFIHSPEHIVYKLGSVNFEFESTLDNVDIESSFEIFALKNKQAWNFTQPFVSFHALFRGEKVRVTLIHFSLSPESKSKMFIRVLNRTAFNITSYVNEEKATFLTSLITTKKNIIVAGATGSGKTTFLNSLLKEIPDNEHIIILEDTYELLSPHNKTTRMIANTNCVTKNINTYLSHAMRMSPERIILGEIRSKEVEAIILALNTGHNGLLTTVHANSAKDAILRLALLFKVYSNKDLSYDLILKLVCSNIDYVIFIEDKKIKEAIQVFGSEKENILFDYAHVS